MLTGGAAVRMFGANRPDSLALERFGDYARGEATIADVKFVLDLVLAAGDWTGHDFERKRLEAMLGWTDAQFEEKAERWRASGLENMSAGPDS